MPRPWHSGFYQSSKPGLAYKKADALVRRLFLSPGTYRFKILRNLFNLNHELVYDQSGKRFSAAAAKSYPVGDAGGFIAQTPPMPATAFTTRYKMDVLAAIPTASAMQQSGLVLHEVIGILWYRLTPAPQQI